MDEDQAEANAAVLVAGGAVAAISRPTGPGAAAPTPTTKHTVRTHCWPGRVFNYAFRFTVVIIRSAKPVTAPLTNIAVHVVQTPLTAKELLPGRYSAAAAATQERALMCCCAGHYAGSSEREGV